MAKKKLCKSNVDCAKGRAMGCNNFCCRMLVRLTPDEMVPSEDGLAPKGYVDKDEEGYCVHFERETGHCKIWEKRPRICREYSCNSDFLLQVVLLNGFINIAETAKQAVATLIPKESYQYIPLTDENENDS